jgi:hypothetical protein
MNKKFPFPPHAYFISSVLKLDTIELMKFSLIMTARIDFQSEAFSPSSKQIDSSATFTIFGGLAMDLTSTKCCFLIDFTAIERKYYFLIVNRLLVFHRFF